MGKGGEGGGAWSVVRETTWQRGYTYILTAYIHKCIYTYICIYTTASNRCEYGVRKYRCESGYSYAKIAKHARRRARWNAF